MLLHLQKLSFSLSQAIERMIPSIERSVFSNLRSYVIKCIFSWLLRFCFIFTKSLHCGPKKLKGKRLVFQREGRKISLILTWSRVFGFEYIFRSLLSCEIVISSIYE